MKVINFGITLEHSASSLTQGSCGNQSEWLNNQAYC